MIGNRISLIYFYLISAVSLGLIIVGVFHSANFIINSTQYDMYPLRYGVDNCEYPYLSPKGPFPASLPEEATPSSAEIQTQRDQCLKNNELDRKQHKLDDLKNAILFTGIGLVLFTIHFPLARKHSRS